MSCLCLSLERKRFFCSILICANSAPKRRTQIFLAYILWANFGWVYLFYFILCSLEPHPKHSKTKKKLIWNRQRLTYTKTITYRFKLPPPLCLCVFVSLKNRKKKKEQRLVDYSPFFIFHHTKKEFLLFSRTVRRRDEQEEEEYGMDGYVRRGVGDWGGGINFWKRRKKQKGPPVRPFTFPFPFSASGADGCFCYCSCWWW